MNRSDDDDACHITVFLHTVFHFIAEKFVFIISRLVIRDKVVISCESLVLLNRPIILLYCSCQYLAS